MRLKENEVEESKEEVVVDEKRRSRSGSQNILKWPR